MRNRRSPDECDRLNEFVVLFHDAGYDSFAILPEAFSCFAEDSDHADDQCCDAYEGCDVVHVYEGHDVNDAYADYADPTINAAIRRLNE